MSITEHTYLCLKCQNIFKVEPDTCPVNLEKVICPKCNSTQIEILPSWSPIGSDLDESQTEWEYECQNCHNVFKLPVPSSPSQEKEITCPRCNNDHIHRLTPTGGEPLYCG